MEQNRKGSLKNNVLEKWNQSNSFMTYDKNRKIKN